MAGYRARILLVQADAPERRVMKAELADAGFEVRTRANAQGIARLVSDQPPDLAILNTRYDKGPDGLDAGRRLRESAGICIIYLAEPGASEECLAAFAAGGDDFVKRPVVPAELRARVEAVLRRSGRLREGVQAIDDITIDHRARAVDRGGHRVNLTSTEFDLFALLVRNGGQVLSKSDMASHLDRRTLAASNVVEVHISSIRKKLETFGPRCVHTERGAGYVFRPAESEAG